VSGLWKLEEPLLLASSSATRLNLLRSASIPVETKAPAVDERAVEEELRGRDLGPEEIALELATAKGLQVSGENPGRLVLAADQTLALGREQFHKPRSAQDARTQLQNLSGKMHALHSAIVCFHNGERIFAHVESARLEMRQLGPAFLDEYVAQAGDSVMSSVGGYQLEGLGIHLFERIEGDQSTILGLPLLPLLAFFRKAGVVQG
jgi:septum formation protein